MKFEFLTFCPGVEYDHGSEPTKKKRKIGRVNLSKKKNNHMGLKFMSQKRP